MTYRRLKQCHNYCSPSLSIHPSLTGAWRDRADQAIAEPTETFGLEAMFGLTNPSVSLSIPLEKTV